MDRYSRMVAFLKVLLPLAALALLSTMFLLSRNIDPGATIPFADHEIAERMRDKTITAPVFSGTTPDGDEITVTASHALPGNADTPATATDFRGKITSPEGLVITLQSDTGTMDMVTNQAIFEGDVRIESSTGYVIETKTLNTSLDKIDASTPGTVTGESPIGHITAGKMTLWSENTTGSVHMLFNNGVKLVYTPKQLEKN